MAEIPGAFPADADWLPAVQALLSGGNCTGQPTDSHPALVYHDGSIPPAGFPPMGMTYNE